MRSNKQKAIAWILGYFVVLFPLMYAKDGSLFVGLLSGITGVGVAVAILITGRKNENNA